LNPPGPSVCNPIRSRGMRAINPNGRHDQNARTNPKKNSEKRKPAAKKKQKQDNAPRKKRKKRKRLTQCKCGSKDHVSIRHLDCPLNPRNLRKQPEASSTPTKTPSAPKTPVDNKQPDASSSPTETPSAPKTPSDNKRPEASSSQPKLLPHPKHRLLSNNLRHPPPKLSGKNLSLHLNHSNKHGQFSGSTP